MDPFSAGSMYEAFHATVEHSPDRIALRERGGRAFTWSDWAALVGHYRAHMADEGVGAAATVALLLDSAIDTYVLDMAAVSAGATAFSIYATSSAPQVAHQLRVSGARLLIAQRSREAIAREAIAVWHIDCILWVVDSVELLADPRDDVPPVPRAPEDVATLIFTSGTTGEPKAAELTHDNVMGALRSSQQMVPLEDGCRLLSYLPPAHIADRVLAYYYALVTGATITVLPEGPRQFIEELPDARPEILLCVPRTWELLKSAIVQRARQEDLEGFESALLEGVQRVRAGDRTAPAEAERIFAKLRAGMGLDRVRLAMSGSAPIPVETLEFFAAIGVWICEGYGLSETTGISVINRADAQRIGTIGLAAPGMEVSLAEDGELLIRGVLVMRGYRGNPEATAAAFTEDGWLRSGDLATIDDEGYVRIVGRKKEVLITSSGKNIVPAQIEQAIIPRTPLIASIVVVGDGRPRPTALVTLNAEAVAARWPDKATLSQHAMARDDDVRAEVAAAIQAGSANFSDAERVATFALLEDTWLPGTDEMTATLKLRRAHIAERYRDVIDAMYAK